MSAKVTLLKEHNGWSKGDIIDVPEALANYLVRCKVAELIKPKAPKEKVKKQPPKK